MLASCLLIEDDSSHALLIERALRGTVGSITRVASSAEARSALSTAVFDVALSDLYLQGEDPQLIRRVISDFHAKLPILVLTSSTSLADAVGAMRDGARDFLVKQFDRDFAALIGLALGRIERAVELERDRSRLQSEMEALRQAIEHSSDPFMVAGLDGSIAYINEAFLRIGKWNRETTRFMSDLTGESQFANLTMAEFLTQKVSQVGEGGAWQGELDTTGDGAKHIFRINLSEIPHDSRRLKSIWLKEITEEKYRERFQRDLISTTTHDLKNPLSAISVSAELLQKYIPAEVSRGLELAIRIRSSAQSALQLVDEFLSAKRIEEGNLVLRPKRIALGPLLEEAVGDLRPILDARGQKFELQSPVELSAVIDSPAFKRVIGNLVGNASKFSPKGSKILIVAERKAGGVLVKVSDAGQGISATELATLFGRFRRLDRHAATEGTGLGLFIVKSLVSAHDGTINISSVLGKGTTFELYFPDAVPVSSDGTVVALG